MRPALYNEIEPYCAQWLRNLIRDGHIPPGHVDERDVRELEPGDLEGYGQIHLFAGIGGFGRAARLAGLPDDFPILTGGFPCQPFSLAGKLWGRSDDRHLWPEMHRLIASVRPTWVLGENIAHFVKMALDGVLSDMEDEDYACWPVCIPACAVDAPHKRDRTWIVAHTTRAGSSQWNGREIQGRAEPGRETEQLERRSPGSLAHSHSQGCSQRPQQHGEAQPRGEEGQSWRYPGGCSDQGNLGHPGSPAGEWDARGFPGTQAAQCCTRKPNGHKSDGSSVAGKSFWADAEWIRCNFDNKLRPVKPGVRLVVDGVPGRVAQIRAFGNAIVPEVAAEIMRAMQ